MEFVANLRKQSIEAFDHKKLQPKAWLLSSHRASPALIAEAHALGEQGRILFADNGTKPMIDAVIRQFIHQARPLASAYRDLRDSLGTLPRGRRVPTSLRQSASDLAHIVVDHCEAIIAGSEWQATLDSQLAIKPSHLIAQEDFATASLIGLGLERELTGWPVSYFNRRAKTTIRYWRRVMSDSRCDNRHVYAVLSGMDYNTAKSAGEIAAKNGVKHIAVGMAGIMRDRSVVDTYAMGRGIHSLGQWAPRRYIRLAQVVRGICDGYRHVGVSPQSLHALGLGAPVMYPVFAAAADLPLFLSVDSTSPIHDAVRDRVLYDPLQDGNRLTLKSIAESVLNGGEWSFTCPFCQIVRGLFGHDPESARLWWKTERPPRMEKAFLDGDHPVGTAMPLLSSRNNPNYSQIRPLHVAHNHWVQTFLCNRIPNEAGPRVEWAKELLGHLITYESAQTTRGLMAAERILA